MEEPTLDNVLPVVLNKLLPLLPLPVARDVTNNKRRLLLLPLRLVFKVSSATRLSSVVSPTMLPRHKSR